MNEAEIAHKILNRRNELSPIVMIGEMQQALGPEGYALALARGWIEPNYDSGQLTISSRDAALVEMGELAKTVKVAPVAESTDRGIFRLFQNNRTRTIVQTASGLVEAEETQIGDEVVVAEEGKPFKATVKARNSDGTYVLSFGAEKPRAERPYKAEELRKTASGPAEQKPGAVQPTTPTR